jgi:peptide chain release factor 3
VAIIDEVRKRRTFAIISHPDAGKTTLTEKLLLYGGAIHVAGQVSARKRQRQATSDWMALERERGISITSTVLQFPYREHTLNLLDTPGHQDFGEDTYRTLLAADSAVMLIDAAKGVEPQTKKLFAICRERGIPLFTFMNKLDRPSRDPLELLDELERVLGIGAFPMNWPLGSGDEFKGVYDRQTRTVHCFERAAHGATRAAVSVSDVSDPQIRAMVSEPVFDQFREGIELLDGAGESFDPAAMLSGATTPVFFGSAVTNFGVELFLNAFVEMAPPPEARSKIDPAADSFTGFVFKIQANMDPRHRDRVAFVRVCSGEFARDMMVRNARSGATLRLSRAMRLFADDRESLETAYAGDVVGLVNPGAFAIGDTLYEGTPVSFPPIPAFAPEHFAAVRSIDVSGYKSFGKGISQLREEGAVQVFYPWGMPRTEPILGAVGQLQFEVAKYRLESEYNVEARFDELSYALALHVEGDRDRLASMHLPSNAKLVEDWNGRPVILFESEWSVRLAQEWNPQLRLTPFSAQLGEEVVA